MYTYTEEDLHNAMVFMEAIMIGEREGWLTWFTEDFIYDPMHDIEDAFHECIKEYQKEEYVEKYGYLQEFAPDWLRWYQIKKYNEYNERKGV